MLSLTHFLLKFSGLGIKQKLISIFFYFGWEKADLFKIGHKSCFMWTQVV